MFSVYQLLWCHLVATEHAGIWCRLGAVSREAAVLDELSHLEGTEETPADSEGHGTMISGSPHM